MISVLTPAQRKYTTEKKALEMEISPLSNLFMPVLSFMEMLISGWDGKVRRIGAAW